MPIDARLMMANYSGFADAGKNIGEAIQANRMGQISDLTGKAMMRDPNAMSALMMRDPMAAYQVQQQLAQQEASAKQAEYENMKRQREEMDWRASTAEHYGKMFAKMPTEEKAMKLHEMLIRQDPRYQMFASDAEGNAGNFDSEDFLLTKMQYGSGLGDMELKEVQSLYNNNPVIKDLQGAKNGFESIRNNYETYMKNPTKNIAAGAAIGKTAIQMVESGVVRPEEAIAFGGLRLPAGSSQGEVVDYIESIIRGGLTPEQVNGLTRLGIDAYNAKAKNAQELQASMIDAGIGAHDPKAVFVGGNAEIIEDFTRQPARQPKTSEEVKKKANDAITRGVELEALGMTDAQIEAQLKKEGLIGASK